MVDLKAENKVEGLIFHQDTVHKIVIMYVNPKGTSKFFSDFLMDFQMKLGLGSVAECQGSELLCAFLV